MVENGIGIHHCLEILRLLQDLPEFLHPGQSSDRFTIFRQIGGKIFLYGLDARDCLSFGLLEGRFFDGRIIKIPAGRCG